VQRGVSGAATWGGTKCRAACERGALKTAWVPGLPPWPSWRASAIAPAEPVGALLPGRVKELEERLAAAEAAGAGLEQQLAASRSQLADSRALMDSTQVLAAPADPSRCACNTCALGGPPESQD
jgi:hypothetical protein